MAAALRQQATACRTLGSPFMGTLLDGLSVRWPLPGALAKRLDAWPDDEIGPAGASLPLRLASGLHALVLSGQAPTLASQYPPAPMDPDDLLDTVAHAMIDHHAFLDTWINSPPQTNEIRRSTAIIPVLHWLTARFGRSIELFEFGASGGLNLWCDRYALQIGGTTYGPTDPVLTLTPDWDGPTPPVADPTIAGRWGCDLNPLDPADPADALRLEAYLWADQTDRIHRTRSAIEIAARRTVPVVERADAADWLDLRRPRMAPGCCRLVYHTVAWQYFPQATRDRLTTTMEAIGTSATEQAPLAWLSMETDGAPDGAALTLRLWPGDETHALGRVDFHGRWLRWRPDTLPPLEETTT